MAKFLREIAQLIIARGLTAVLYTDHNGARLTLEDECLRSGTLPSLAYGHKKCSLKHKAGPQNTFCNRHPGC
jgi:hypothetical protein